MKSAVFAHSDEGRVEGSGAYPTSPKDQVANLHRRHIMWLQPDPSIHEVSLAGMCLSVSNEVP